MSPDGKRLVTTLLVGSAIESRVYDIARHELLPGLRDARTKPPGKNDNTGYLRDNAKRKLSLDMLNGQAIILRHADNQTEIVNLEDPDRDDACFTQDGDYVVSWKLAETRDVEAKSEYAIASAKIWDIQTGTLLTALSGDGAVKLVKSLARSPRVFTTGGKPWSLHQALMLPDRETLKSFIAKELPLRFQGDVLIAKPAR